jgi:hypothetical protein
MTESEKKLNRRDFLKIAAGAGVVIGTGVVAKKLYDWQLAPLNEIDEVKAFSTDIPEPTVAPEPTEELFSELYSKEKLLKLREIEQKPMIDQMIGAVHVNGLYPREDEVGFFEYGVDVLTKLGFQTTEIALVPQEFKEHTGMEISFGTTLDQLVQRPDVTKVFENPILKNVLITTEVAGVGTVNAWQLPNKDAFTPEALEATHQEYYRFASQLLEKFGDSGKEIVVLGTNEIDWKAMGGTDADITADLTSDAIENSIKYLNEYLRAISDANKDNPGKKPLKSAIEINRVRDIWRGNKRILNAVIPELNIQPDMVGYSFYGRLCKGNLFTKAIDEIKKWAPQSEVVISEFGLPENREDVKANYTTEDIANLYDQRIQEAKSKGVKYFMIWQLTDNECQKPNPDNDQCNGFWIVRPDGSLSEIYDVFAKYQA